jgi:hypothetical protein
MNLSRQTQSTIEPQQTNAASLSLFPFVKFGSSHPNRKTAVPVQFGSSCICLIYLVFPRPTADAEQPSCRPKAIRHPRFWRKQRHNLVTPLTKKRIWTGYYPKVIGSAAFFEAAG